MEADHESQIESMLKGENRIICKVYGNCNMRIEDCVARYRNALRWQNNKVPGRPGYAGSNQFKPGAGDVNCRNCEQGRKAMEELEVTGAQEGATEITVEETKVCSDERCESDGDPQPIGNFMLNAFSKQPVSVCKKCMTRRRLETRAKNKNPMLTVSPELKTRTETKTPEQTLVIDFQKYPATLEQIKKIAERLMRAPETQVLFWLVNADFEKLEGQG